MIVDYRKLLKIFINNFLSGGFIIGVSLVILELLMFSAKGVSFYAFATAGFFIYNIFQFNHASYTKPKYTETFLLHTIIGGCAWVSYAIIMYILYKLNYNRIENVIMITIIYIFGTVGYFLLLKNNLLKF